MAAVIIPQNLPVGYRFHPTDEEFVHHYLKNRVLGYVDRPCVIPDVDICRWDPWELPHKFHGESIIPPDDKVQEWWFFCLQTPKQVRRSTPSGFWKKTGADRNVKDRDTNRVIGTKKTLVFHKGQGSKGINTKWVIHEFHLPANELNRNYVLCWLKHTRDEKADNSTIELAHGAINLADLDSDLHQPDYENSFLEPLIQEMLNSPIEPSFQPEDRISSDFLPLLQPARRSQNSLPSNINQFMNSPSLMDFSLDFPLENRFQPDNRVSSDMLQLFHPARQSQNSLPSNRHQFRNTENPSFMPISWENSIPDESIQLESLFGTSEEDEDFGNMLNDDLFEEVEDVEVPSGDLFYDDFFDGDQMQTGYLIQARMDSLIESSERSVMDFALDDGLTDEYIQLVSETSEEDEDVGYLLNGDLVDADFFHGDQMQTLYGQTPNLHNECPVLMENRRAQTMDSIHGVVPLEEKKGLVENKFSGSLVALKKPMAPPVRAAGVKYYGKDEVLRFGKVKQETAATSIKPEYIFFDETAARAKDGQISVMESRQTRMIGSLHGVVPLEQKKGIIQSKVNSSHASSAKSMELPKKPKIPRMPEPPRMYINEELWLRKVKKQESALRNVKTECVSFDKAAATAKVLKYREHRSASNLPRKAKSRESEHAREKANIVTALTSPTAKSTKSSTNPPRPNFVNVLVGIFLFFAVTCQVFNL
ncbi:NAC domain-containing protein 53-like isoform X1 [Rhodamnia argentea]|uniref:NAC domain-containing protein 53-like isoform X1 n=1 Tax=Rhodamnia argentea TaxID=178133 RepID=A0A8B8PVG9_9MYRT|nr:NAC domain-containing protein 53-like isoform X1 [Rhodamnia argentea]XP_048134811.1 NAC domain-containing protein 53-like isoform X1 [Rhodamnia argentea]